MAPLNVPIVNRIPEETTTAMHENIKETNPMLC
jgi:hypothetical protein